MARQECISFRALVLRGGALGIDWFLGGFLWFLNIFRRLREHRLDFVKCCEGMSGEAF